MDERRPDALTPELALSQFAMQRKREQIVLNLNARGTRALVRGVALYVVGGVAAFVAPPEWYEAIVFPLAGLGSLLAGYGAFLLFGARMSSRPRG